METESEQLESIPMTVCVEFVGISNVAGLKTKLFEFNEGVEERFKLNTTDKAHLERYIMSHLGLYRCSKTKRHTTSGLSISRSLMHSKRFSIGPRNSSFQSGTSSEIISNTTKARVFSVVSIEGWILLDRYVKLSLIQPHRSHCQD